MRRIQKPIYPYKAICSDGVQTKKLWSDNKYICVLNVCFYYSEGGEGPYNSSSHGRKSTDLVGLGAVRLGQLWQQKLK